MNVCTSLPPSSCPSLPLPQNLAESKLKLPTLAADKNVAVRKRGR